VHTAASAFAGNVTLARRHLEQAAEGGSAQAHAGLGYLYMTGAARAGIHRNLSLAVTHLLRAAAAGYPNAHTNLAAIYLMPARGDTVGVHTDGVPYNASGAKWHLEQAAASSDLLPALFNLGIIAFNGMDAPDPSTATAAAAAATSGAAGGRADAGGAAAAAAAEQLAAEVAAAGLPPGCNCSAALGYWAEVATRSGWLQDSVFNFEAAFSLFQQGTAARSRLLPTWMSGATLWGGGLLGPIRRLFGPAALPADGSPDSGVEHTGPMQRSLLQYLVLSSVGIRQAQDNAAFLLRSGLITKEEAANLLTAGPALLHPLNDTLPMALRTPGMEDDVVVVLAGDYAAQRQKRRVPPSLIAFAAGSPLYRLSTEATLPRPTRYRQTDEVLQMLHEFGHLGVLSANALAHQLAMLAARQGSAYAAKLAGDCHADGWPGVLDCNATGTARYASTTALVELVAASSNPNITSSGAGAVGSAGVGAGESGSAGDSGGGTFTEAEEARRWYELAASRGLAHAVFRLAELQAGSAGGRAAGRDAGTGAAGGAAGNVTLAWETLYRVAPLDYLGDWPVLVARARLVVVWLADAIATPLREASAQAGGFFTGGAKPLSGGAADDALAPLVAGWRGVADALSGVWECVRTPPSHFAAEALPPELESGHGLHPDVEDEDDDGWWGQDDDAAAAEAQPRSHRANSRAGASSRTERSALSSASRETAAAAGAEGAAQAHDGASADAGASGSTPAPLSGEAAQRAEEEELRRRADAAAAPRYRIGPWPVDAATRMHCSAWARALFFAVVAVAAATAAGLAAVLLQSNLITRAFWRRHHHHHHAHVEEDPAAVAAAVAGG
jgi:hypothetical protein